MNSAHPLHLNNQAIRLMQQGNYTKAEKTLRKALQCTCNLSPLQIRRNMRTNPNKDHADSYKFYIGNKRRKCLRESRSEKRLNGEVDWTGGERKRRIRSIPITPVKGDGLKDPSATLATRTKTEEQQGSFTFFDRALTIDDDGDDILLVEGQYMFVCSGELRNFKAILLHNLALTYHMDALRCGSSRKLVLALQFYKLTFDFLERLKELIPMEEMILQLLALFTNMTSIHTFRFDIEMVSFYMGWMETAILSKEVQSLDYDDFEYFYYNIVVFSARDQVRLAPAA